MLDLPFYISTSFVLITFLTVWIFYKAAGNSKSTLLVLGVWLAVQAGVGLTGFYTVTNTLPPRFLLLLGPTLVVIVGLFLSKRGRVYLDEFDIGTLTLLHVIRIPVEMVLFGLFMHKAIPEIMTFEGRNLDIVSGISAPILYYLVFKTKHWGRIVLMVWNIICLGLLANIVTIAILSTPLPFQKFGFEQPNIGVFYFPFVWLPCCVVPLVLLSHLAALRQLLVKPDFLKN